MAVVPRKRKSGTTYYVTFQFQGRAVWERVGSDRREAERLDARRKRELKAGTYQPAKGATRPTVGQYAAAWGAARTNASAKDDRRNLARFTSDPDFARLLVEDVRPRHVIEALDRLKGAGTVTLKTLQNAYGTLRTMFRDARIRELAVVDPCVLPRGYFSGGDVTEREPYAPAELWTLVNHVGIPWPVRVLNALCLFAGLREGEACGRRWRDLDDGPTPLACMAVRDQYGGAPLKTKRPRVVPVHPELGRILTAWAERGFEELTCRRPGPDDFIVPRIDRRGRVTHHTKSTYYKAFAQACAAAGVRARSLHSTRHTFITLCLRGGADKRVLERVTHNARGDVIDRYTHRDWAELCAAVLCLDRALDARLDPHRTLNSPQDSGPENTGRGAFLLKEAGRARADDPSSIPGASTTKRAQKGQKKEQRQDGSQETESAPVSIGALDDFEIALAEGSERAAVAELLEAPLCRVALPAVVRVGLFRREREPALRLTAGGGHAG